MVFLSGCLFHDTPPTRYYAPLSGLASNDDPRVDPPPAAQPVRLRRVRAASYLTEQIVWRSSDVESGLYEQRRWTEFPSRYLERAMVTALNRTPGIRRVESDPHVPTLDVELLSFEEVLAPAHEADVEVAAVLRAPNHEVVFDRVFSARRPISDPTGAGAARAIGAALDDVVQQVAAQVAAQVPRSAPSRPKR